ncbi:MAG: hypothetical protein GW795_12050 [Cyanobacteria bacterium]|nr:hypothetical protein [Cyanobacteria bacterium CG_2015-16_32_12]NCO78850.1 hypothetical protein [Cyanobacteria bacterium CG_2015-22_32_23]NCQ05654.1 hypothetical protein [Cyanobacteria bacterium CG_2015-09_32_10]NCQ42578.1 hypothetical protein [Cyanobacteria bacterium CG_2015-04_32_10]NCS84715.1 hypothetical protein [Cyanobacteria bacterium CG_2015-02_32_10]
MSQKHPNKEIREIIEYGVKKGWIVKESNGHAWGILYCPYNNKNCRAGKHCKTSIWSTPTDPQYFAKHLKRIIDKCNYTEENTDELL